jgi:hypothetical protein
MGRYATVNFEDNKVEFKFTGLMSLMAYDVGVICDQELVTLSFEDIGRIIDRLGMYHIADAHPSEAYYVGMIMVWYGMHDPGDKLTFG